jgi:hypothetical protein
MSEGWRDAGQANAESRTTNKGRKSRGKSAKVRALGFEVVDEKGPDSGGPGHFRRQNVKQIVGTGTGLAVIFQMVAGSSRRQAARFNLPAAAGSVSGV